ncbi:MAG: hypothetical protein PHT40_00825 [Patescibacteria group bacterium]|nr:hypothetical protein [Patescibacteria group bacterium]
MVKEIVRWNVSLFILATIVYVVEFYFTKDIRAATVMLMLLSFLVALVSARGKDWVGASAASAAFFSTIPIRIIIPLVSLENISLLLVAVSSVFLAVLFISEIKKKTDIKSWKIVLPMVLQIAANLGVFLNIKHFIGK